MMHFPQDRNIIKMHHAVTWLGGNILLRVSNNLPPPEKHIHTGIIKRYLIDSNGDCTEYESNLEFSSLAWIEAFYGWHLDVI